ncbi:hypothetical protein BD309DRAFT_970713 [Dichomitus squalens]|nr:hypothetical protein BD309DRAFT_970713 [Dichomitus squalens]
MKSHRISNAECPYILQRRATRHSNKSRAMQTSSFPASHLGIHTCHVTDLRSSSALDAYGAEATSVSARGASTRLIVPICLLPRGFLELYLAPANPNSSFSRHMSTHAPYPAVLLRASGGERSGLGRIAGSGAEYIHARELTTPCGHLSHRPSYFP